MSLENPPDSQSLLKYLTITHAEAEEKFAILERREKERRQIEGCFVDHPIAHARNRWTTARPYANNRIRLRNSPYDYINASPIEIGDLKYIATQNPTSIDDFWRMTWDENVNSITILMPIDGRGGDDRCAQYYPRQRGEVITTANFQIEQVNDAPEDLRTEVRELRISHGTEPSRTIWHFAFLAWPDHGVPQGRGDRRALLNLIKLSRFQLQPTVPRLIHCSAGCGRTGTFIALDYLLEEFERGALDSDSEVQIPLDPVFETVDYLREKRIMMVQTAPQFYFIYSMLLLRLKDKRGVRREGDEEGEGEEDDVGSNLYYTFVFGGPKLSVKKARWQGIPQRIETSNPA